MNRHERTEILERVMEDLKDWDWNDSFEISKEEGKALLFLLKGWDDRREYLKNHYAADRENRIAQSKKRYWDHKRRICSG